MAQKGLRFGALLSLGLVVWGGASNFYTRAGRARYGKDQFTLLHVAMGVVAYFWGMPFWLALGIHIVFEIVENTAWVSLSLITG